MAPVAETTTNALDNENRAMETEDDDNTVGFSSNRQSAATATNHPTVAHSNETESASSQHQPVLLQSADTKIQKQRQIKWSLISFGLLAVFGGILGVAISLKRSSTALQSCAACPAGMAMSQWDAVFATTTNMTDDNATTLANMSWFNIAFDTLASNATNETEPLNPYPTLLGDLSCAEVDALAANYSSNDPECGVIQQYVPDLCQCQVPTPAPTNRPSVSSMPTSLPSSQPSMMPVPTNPPTQHPVGPPVRNFDRFTYEETLVGDDQTDYGPEEWHRVQCPDKLSCVRTVQTIQQQLTYLLYRKDGRILGITLEDGKSLAATIVAIAQRSTMKPIVVSTIKVRLTSAEVWQLTLRITTTNVSTCI